MKFYSTNDRGFMVSFDEAMNLGLAPDGGLFMPEGINLLPDFFWNHFKDKNFREISFEVAKHFLGLADRSGLKEIISDALSFDAPLVEVSNRIYALELFHGPTLAFKDFGARFLASIIGSQVNERGREVTILVATSGDTGGAVANGFLDIPGTHVVVLYPSGKVSDMQERQFATLGKNITAVELNGTFDDCQRLVKQAFRDPSIASKRNLTSANSINIARLLPQMFYYFRAIQQLPDAHAVPVIVSVPSGNFGNLTAGLMAKRMGLRINHFIAATNLNDPIPEYLHSGTFRPRPSIATISNAMDVGDPSNFVRMLNLFDYDVELMRKEISGYRISEEQTEDSINEVSNSGYLMDPHGAVAYSALKQHMIKIPNDSIGIFLATAHPGKFRETVERIISSPILIPDRLSAFSDKEKRSVKIENDFDELRELLLD